MTWLLFEVFYCFCTLVLGSVEVQLYVKIKGGGGSGVANYNLFKCWICQVMNYSLKMCIRVDPRLLVWSIQVWFHRCLFLFSNSAECMDIDEDRPLHSIALSERGKFVSIVLFVKRNFTWSICLNWHMFLLQVKEFFLLLPGTIIERK